MPSTIATIDTKSIVSNISWIREHAPKSRISAVVKNNAYGHGVNIVAKSVENLVDGFSVATVDEGVELRKTVAKKPIWVLTGFSTRDELADIADLDLVPVVHSEFQIEQLKKFGRRLSVLFEIDTGLGRLGFKPEAAEKNLATTETICNVEVIMSHFSHADHLGSSVTKRQMQVFDHCTQNMPYPKSIANSGGILDSKDYHLDWIRPGLILYGVSPFIGRRAEDLELSPAFTLTSRIVSIRTLRQGDRVGYGGLWECPTDMLVGIVRCGYGDGYPRVLSDDAKVRTDDGYAKIIGRISMDSLVIDARFCQTIKIGDQVELWGQDLPIEDVARNSLTIPNELLTRVTERVTRVII